MKRHILAPFDGAGESLATQTRHRAESIEIIFSEDSREILIEITNGKIKVRCYDGHNDSPFTVIIPQEETGIKTDSHDYDKG